MGEGGESLGGKDIVQQKKGQVNGWRWLHGGVTRPRSGSDCTIR